MSHKKKLRTVIIEDEKPSLEDLTDYIEESKFLSTNLELIGSAGSVLDGIELINLEKPDLVLLDLKLMGGDAFDILDKFKPPFFSVIFITSMYFKFAKELFVFFSMPQFQIVSKGWEENELENSVKEIIDGSDDLSYPEGYEEIVYSFKEIVNKKIKPDITKGREVKSKHHKEGVVTIKVDKVIKLVGGKSSTNVYYEDPVRRCEKKIIYPWNIGKCFSGFEAFMPDRFCRVHKSYAVSLAYIAEFDKNRVILKNGDEVPISNANNYKLLNGMWSAFQNRSS